MTEGSEPAGHRYLVVGAGAIGGTLAFVLTRAGHRVTLVEIDETQRTALGRSGVTIDTGVETQTQRVHAVLAPDDPSLAGARFSRVLLAVKSQHTSTAALWIADHLAPDGYVVSCQNGDNEPLLLDVLGEGRVVGAFVDIAADVVAPGVIRSGGVTNLVVGELDGADTARLSELVDDLDGVAQAAPNVIGMVWAKAALAAMYIATALADEDIGVLIDRHRPLMLALSREVTRIAAAEGQKVESLGHFEVAEYLDGVSPERVDAAFDRLVVWHHGVAKKRTGIFRDIAVRHRRSEGHVELDELRASARRHGIATPLLSLLDTLLSEVESGVRPFTEANLDDLARAIPHPSS